MNEANKRPDLTADRLRELVSYDPQNGVFRWVAPPKHKGPAVGKVAGSDHGGGYRKIKIDGRQHLAHRLAWLYVHGEWPRGLLDHVNGDRGDNRIVNLREATEAQNGQNRRRSQSNNAARLLGVAPTRSGRWKAQIHVAGKQTHLGTFATPEQAHEAYLSAKVRLHEFAPRQVAA